MRKRKEKPKDIKAISKFQLQTDICNEAYRQINAVSFQQNFAMLVGHFRRPGQETESRIP